MPWMPTIVAKGRIFREFEDALDTPQKQIAYLRMLRTIVGTGADPVDAAKVFSGNLFSGADDVRHTKEDWFGVNRGPRSSFFRTLSLPKDPNDSSKLDVNGSAAVGAPTDTFVQDGEWLIVQGMIEALQAALGIGDAPGEDNFGNPPFNNLPEARPIEIFWVCGKGSGFECEVAVNPRQVTLFIITPPINSTVDAIEGSTEDREAVKRLRGRAMISLRQGANRETPVKKLMALKDGGVNPPDNP